MKAPIDASGQGSSLRDTQEWMATLLRRRRALPRDAEVTAKAREHVTGNPRLSPVEQVELYREQFWLRHTAALLEDFPGLSGVLGQADWERLVEGYLSEIAPTSWSLRDLGDRLPEYVERAAWLPHHELCVDMARLEWARVELFDSADVPPVDPVVLGAIPEDAWGTARLVLSPAVRLLRARYPVAALRRSLESSTDARDSVPIPEPLDTPLVLYRGADLNVSHSDVSAAAFALLEALAEGMALVPACERAATRVPEEARDLERTVGEWFMDWGRRGWVVHVETR